MTFPGPDFDEKRDGARLTSQLDRIRRLMLDGEERSLQQIADETGDPAASVSAQLRHLRRKEHGAYRVEKRHVENGFFLYRVLPPLPAEQIDLFREVA